MHSFSFATRYVNSWENLLFRGFNEAVSGFTDEGWTLLEGDGVDDVTVLVNSSPGKMMGANLSYANGFPAMGNAVLCAKASMLLQVHVLTSYCCAYDGLHCYTLFGSL